MEKLTFDQLRSTFIKFNEEHHVTQFDKTCMTGAIVFKPENWPDKNYSIEARTYEVSSANKYFIPGCGGNSIFANCADGSDNGVRLDWYMFDIETPWEIDYCYIINE
ncbi:MAG: hypothetical protein KBT28_10855 [Bacteroidales bacterium]|nr:hypothetical protein [Candidatus Colimorpha merdihippi]